MVYNCLDWRLNRRGDLMILHLSMEHEDRMSIHHGDASEQGLKDNAALRLMSAIIAERDAATLERNTALAEKKTAYAERDAALLQRDVAYADCNAVLLERDEAVSALEQIRDGSMNDSVRLSCGILTGTKLFQVLAENPTFGIKEYQSIQPVSVAFSSQVLEVPTGKPQKQTKLAFKKKDNPSKRKLKISTTKKPSTETATSGEESNEQLTVIKHEQNDQALGNSGIVFDTLPIPICSCTGVPRQCYRWGTGGWQSACCTTTISMYPLPMNRNKCGACVTGRKMTAGAFIKVLQRLFVEGHTLFSPIDLKNHWARHGTNRFVTIS